MSIVKEHPQSRDLRLGHWRGTSLSERGSYEDDGPTNEEQNKREEEREFPPMMK
jgi:hypothetical protein